MEKKKDLPYMPFYVGDWRKAPDIRSLSLEERCLWFEMLCLMWESPRRGFLTVDGKSPLDDNTLGRMLGEQNFVITKIKQVLEQKNIYSIEETTGIIFNRRMVRDEEIRISRSKAGVLGMGKRYKKDVCYNKSGNKTITNGITNGITNADNDNDIDIDNNIKRKRKRDAREKEKKEEKKIYLDFVYLTDEEYKNLLNRFGSEAEVAERIERLNNYIGSKGVKYASHYHTILSWSKKDTDKTKTLDDRKAAHLQKIRDEERKNEKR